MPSLAAGFLRDILERPEDDSVRLIYADWLQDHGEQDRAEFIRLQCERARRGPDAPPEKREETLLKKHRVAWEKEIPAWARRQVRFERGFIVHIQCTARDFLAGSDGLFRRAPVQSIEFRTYSERTRELAACPELSRLRELTFDGWHGDHLRPGGARAFFRSPHLAGLRVLNLAASRLGPTGIQALADCPHLAGLTRLELNGNDLGPKGAAALAGSSHLTSLTHLNLGYNRIGDRGFAALASSPTLRRLTDLEVWDNALTDRSTQALAEAPWMLTSLSLARNPIGNAGARWLASSKHLSHLTTLVLSETYLTAAGVRALAGSPHLAGLQQFDLEDNPLGDEGALALAASPHLGSLVRLNLRDTGVRDEGALALAASPSLSSLAFLDLFEILAGFNKQTVALLRKRFGSDGVVCFSRR
jgi:uncharacterized protein (TIGR02996 family)